MLADARSAHPHIRFEEGELAALPIDTGVLAGAVCWYSIIYTPPDRLGEAFNEPMRVLIPGGYVLLGFQAGSGEPANRAEAHRTHLPLTSYQHSLEEVAAQLQEARFTICAKVERAPALEHEMTSQGFVFARRAT
jgi:hypothetical protein